MNYELYFIDTFNGWGLFVGCYGLFHVLACCFVALLLQVVLVSFWQEAVSFSFGRFGPFGRIQSIWAGLVHLGRFGPFWPFSPTNSLYFGIQ